MTETLAVWSAGSPSAAAASGAGEDQWTQSAESVAGWHDKHAWAESSAAGAQHTTPWPESGEGWPDGRAWAVSATAQSPVYAAVTEYSSHVLLSSPPSSAAGRPSCDIRVTHSVSERWEVQRNWSENPSPWGNFQVGARAPPLPASSPFGQGRWKTGKTVRGVDLKIRTKYARKVQYLAVQSFRDSEGRPEHFNIHEWAKEYVAFEAYKEHRTKAKEANIHVAEEGMEEWFIDRVRVALIDMWVENSKKWRRMLSCPHNAILPQWHDSEEPSSIAVRHIDSLLFDKKATKRFHTICMAEEDIMSPNMRHRTHRQAAVAAGDESGSDVDASDFVEKEPRAEAESVATVVTPMYGSDVDASTVAEKEPLARAESAAAFVKPADAEEAIDHPFLALCSGVLGVLSQMVEVDASTVAEKESIAQAESAAAVVKPADSELVIDLGLPADPDAALRVVAQIEVNNLWQLRPPLRPVCNAASFGPVDSMVREYEKTKTERMCHQEDAMIRDLREEVLRCQFVTSILPFGSRATGLGLPDSDYDMHIQVCGKTTGTVPAMALMQTRLRGMKNTEVVPKPNKWTLEVLHQGLWFDLKFDLYGEWDDKNVTIAKRLKDEGLKLLQYERHAVRLLIDILKSKVEGTTIKPAETVVWDKVKCGSYGGQLKGVMIAHMCFAAFATLRKGTHEDIQDWRRCLQKRASEAAALDYLVAFIMHMPFEQLVLDPFGVNGNVLRLRSVNTCTPAYCLDPLGTNVLRRVTSEQLARLQSVCESLSRVLRHPPNATAFFLGLKKCRDEQWGKMFKYEQGKVARAESAAAVVAPMPSSGVDASHYVEKQPRARVVTFADSAIQVGQQPPPLIVAARQDPVFLLPAIVRCQKSPPYDPQRIPRRTQWRIFWKIPWRISRRIPRKIPQSIPQRTSQRIPQRISRRISRGISPSIPPRILPQEKIPGGPFVKSGFS